MTTADHRKVWVILPLSSKFNLKSQTLDNYRQCFSGNGKWSLSNIRNSLSVCFRSKSNVESRTSERQFKKQDGDDRVVNGALSVGHSNFVSLSSYFSRVLSNSITRDTIQMTIADHRKVWVILPLSSKCHLKSQTLDNYGQCFQEMENDRWVTSETHFQRASVQNPM